MDEELMRRALACIEGDWKTLDGEFGSGYADLEAALAGHKNGLDSESLQLIRDLRAALQPNPDGDFPFAPHEESENGALATTPRP